jgi:hypothetical protein
MQCQDAATFPNAKTKNIKILQGLYYLKTKAVQICLICGKNLNG